MKKLLSLILSLMLFLAVFPLTANASSITAQQLFKYSDAPGSMDDMKNGITVLDNGDIFTIVNKNVLMGFKSDGTPNGFSAALPSDYTGNLCTDGEMIFAHSTNSSQVFIYEPLKSNECKTLYGGSVCHSLAVDENGYLYCLQGETNSADKKIAVIRRIKISSVKALNNEDYISWEKSYFPNYDAPNESKNAYPKALAVDSIGNAYIVDKGSSNGYDASVNGIYKYNMNTGKVTAMKFVDAGGTLVGMTWLYSVNVDSFGNVAVLSRNSNMIALFRNSSANADTFIKTSGWVEDVASDAEGNLYFISNGNTNTGNSVFKCELANVAISDISLSCSSKTITAGASFTLKASVLPSNATNKSVVYTSSDSSVVAVSESGVVKGVKQGTAVITVKTAQGGLIAKCTVTVNKAENTLTASGKRTTVKFAKLKKKNQTVKAAKAVTVKNAKGAVSYKKSKGNKKITVAKNGKITIKKGLKKGTYKIKIKVTAAGNASYKAATKTVTVKIIIK